MTARSTPAQGRPPSGKAVFPLLSRVHFAASYPEGPHKLRHDLGKNPLLELDALAQLGERLSANSVEYDHGELPIGKAIREIETGKSRVVLKNIEQQPAYAALLAAVLGEIESEIVARTGRMAKPHASLFISSPNATTPFRFDPEHHLVLQLAGEKTVTVFPAGEAERAPDSGAGRELDRHEHMACHGASFRLVPGEAIYVPVMAPHHVRNGPAPSISLSISWRSAWSSAEADARAFNAFIRRRGFDPKPPGRWPERNTAKAIAWRVLRRMPGLNLNAG